MTVQVGPPSRLRGAPKRRFGAVAARLPREFGHFPPLATAPTARRIPAWANGPGHDQKGAEGLKARPMRWHCRRSIG